MSQSTKAQRDLRLTAHALVGNTPVDSAARFFLPANEYCLRVFWWRSAGSISQGTPAMCGENVEVGSGNSWKKAEGMTDVRGRRSRAGL